MFSIFCSKYCLLYIAKVIKKAPNNENESVNQTKYLLGNNNSEFLKIKIPENKLKIRAIKKESITDILFYLTKKFLFNKSRSYRNIESRTWK